MCVLPGRQLLVLQTEVCLRGPIHGIPPGSASRRIVLFRVDKPPPQVALHSLQVDHSLRKQPAEEKAREREHRWMTEKHHQLKASLFICNHASHVTWTWWHLAALRLLRVGTGRTTLFGLAEACPWPGAIPAGNWARAPGVPGLVHRAGKLGACQSAILTYTADRGVHFMKAAKIPLNLNQIILTFEDTQTYKI